MELKQSTLPIADRNGLTLLDEMVCQAIYATLGKLLSASFASVLIAVAGVLQLRTALEKLEDELVRFTTHFACYEYC